MILLDFSAVAIANISRAIKMEGEILTKEFALHMIMNSIRASNVKFRNDFGSMIVCCDTSHNWRKDEFKYYKYKRKKDRGESDIDWDFIFECLNYAKDEISRGFPYNDIEIDGAEADDIIGVLAKHATEIQEPTVIVSNDKDFVQRHSNMVCQYRPCENAFIRNENPARFLKELIIKGDKDDGVPNIKSPDNQFTEEVTKKQASIYTKDLDIWLEDDDNTFLEGEKNKVLKTNFLRNEKLINLDFTPHHIVEQIMEKYKSGKRPANMGEMTKFFMKNRLRQLHERILDFV